MKDNARSPGTHQSLPQELLSRKPNRERAFTQIELLAVCAALLLVALVVAPAAVSSKSDSERLICFNNLRLVGRGVQIWASEHNQQVPWQTLVSEGGTRPDSGAPNKPGSAWIEYAFLTNELVRPKILACPSDVGVQPADDWRQFTLSGFRANATSYSMAMDVTPDAPGGCVSSDRNLRFDSYGATSCAARINDAGTILNTGVGVVTRWTNAVHGEFGHVLSLDGSVELTSNARLKEILYQGNENGVNHFLKAR